MYFNRLLFWQIIRFALSGLLATLLYGLIALALKLTTSLDFMVINLLSYVLSIPLSYTLQKFFTFHSSASHTKAFPRFVVTAFIALIVSTIIAKFIIQKLNYPEHVGFLSVMIIVPLISLVLMQLWVFTENKYF